MSGQVTRDSPFGKALVKYAARPDINKMLDVGTWTGQGTTECLAYGAHLKQLNSQLSIVSVEANSQLHKIACQYYGANKPPFLHLICGTLTKDIMKPNDIIKHPLFEKVKTHYELHYTKDVCHTINAPLIDFQGAKVDMVVLDGGEFCGESDFNCCMTLCPKVIALDDINVIKNSNNYAWLMKNNKKWQLMDSGEDRNGWAIFERKRNFDLEDMVKMYNEKYGTETSKCIQAENFRHQ